MFKRLRFPSVASRRDVLLMAAAVLVVFAITAVWGVFLAGQVNPFRGQNASKYFLTLLFFGAAAVVGGLPFVTRWDREQGHRLARLFVRAGTALMLFAVVASLVGLFYATDPVRSVPVGYATFTAMLIGLFMAGFAGNALIPDRA
jgi:cation transport ATPase